MGRQELINAVRNELRARPAGLGIDIAVLTEDYGAGIQEVLWDLYTTDQVDLVELGTGIAVYEHRTGYTRDQLVSPEAGRWFTQVMARV